jgi:regulator of protease activity HflC (stomatin/prohibitin superfamily)
MKSSLTVLAASTILVLTLLLTSMHTVPSGSVGFVSTFNVINPETRGPGVTFTIPFVQEIKTINVQQVTVPEEFHVQTLDKQVITVTGTAIYNINPNNAATTAINIGTDANKIKQNAFQSQFLATVKQEVAIYNMDDAIGKQEQIGLDIEKKLRARLNKTGTIKFDSFNLTGFKPSDDVQEAIEQTQVALQRKKQADTDLETAKITAQANKILSDSISPALNQQKAIEKWNGQSQVFNVNGSAGNTSVILPSK